MSGMTSSLMEALGEPLRVVWRNGGRSCDRWRVVFQSYSKKEAVDRFRQARNYMRQGGLMLREYSDDKAVKHDNGECLVEYTAPRLRTRW